MSTPLQSALTHAREHHDNDLADLFTLLMQQSISAQNLGVQECAALEESLLQDAGFVTRRLATVGHPILYGEWLKAPGKPTVLFYGHYDVQPPDPLEKWESAPFTPTIRDGRIYARGVADNKAQHFSHIAAVRHWLRATGSLPVNVKILLEGEEEIGSPHLDEVVAANKDLLAADLVYTSDGPVTDERYPEIVFGVRGILYVELTATGANRDLHSGHWGGVAPNPILTLARLLTSMIDAENHITIDGFYDNVLPPTPGAESALAQLPFNTAATLAGVGLSDMVPPAGRSYAERVMFQPTLNPAGFTGGYSGPGSKTVLPATASLKIDMRLVPNQTPDEIWEKISAHLKQFGQGVSIRRVDGGMLPSVTPVEHPLATPVRAAVAAGFGSEPISVPSAGGSLPDAVWTKTLGLPSFLVPYGAPEQANHSPNENFRLERLWQGIETSINLLGLLGDRDTA